MRGCRGVCVPGERLRYRVQATESARRCTVASEAHGFRRWKEDEKEAVMEPGESLDFRKVFQEKRSCSARLVLLRPHSANQ